MFLGTFELSEQVSAEKNPAYGTDTGQEYEADEDHGFGRLGGTEGNGGGLDYGVDRRVLLYLGLGELELLGSLVVEVVGQVHLVLQTFLTGLDAAEQDVLVFVYIVGIALLGFVIFLLGFVVELLCEVEVVTGLVGTVVSDVILQLLHDCIGERGRNERILHGDSNGYSERFLVHTYGNAVIESFDNLVFLLGELEGIDGRRAVSLFFVARKERNGPTDALERQGYHGAPPGRTLMFLKIIVDSGLEFAVGIAYGYVEQFGRKGDRRDDIRIKVG